MTRQVNAAPDVEIEGQTLHQLAARMFPINRSITGDGVRETLQIISAQLPGLRIHEVPSGSHVLDWVIPDEWNVKSAFLDGPHGERIIDFSECNVHLMSYSEPIDKEISLEELQDHLHSDPEHQDAIPYVTSYYNRNWAFCLTAQMRERLPVGTYRARIDSSLQPGHLTYGELVIPGNLTEEVLVSTYVCHPSLANNELSGPVVAVGIAQWLLSLQEHRYTYRFVFAPETIGAITYISRNLKHLRDHVVGAINLTCIGDDGDYSYLASRLGTSPLDRIARRVVRTRPRPVEYSYLDRGSDERQYGMPGIDVPMISLMRSKYGVYPQYHTHLDDLSVVTPSGLQGGLDLVRDCLIELEHSNFFLPTVLAEPQLGRRGLYHSMHARTVADDVLLRTHILAYADGEHSLTDIAELSDAPVEHVQTLVEELIEHGLLISVPLQARCR